MFRSASSKRHRQIGIVMLTPSAAVAFPQVIPSGRGLAAAQGDGGGQPSGATQRAAGADGSLPAARSVRWRGGHGRAPDAAVHRAFRCHGRRCAPRHWPADTSSRLILTELRWILRWDQHVCLVLTPCACCLCTPCALTLVRPSLRAQCGTGFPCLPACFPCLMPRLCVRCRSPLFG